MHTVYVQGSLHGPVAWELPHPVGTGLTILGPELLLVGNGNLHIDPLTDEVLG